MLQMLSRLDVADNTGARQVQMIRRLGQIAQMPLSPVFALPREIEDAIATCHIARHTIAIEQGLTPGDMCRRLADDKSEPINRVIVHLEEQL